MQNHEIKYLCFWQKLYNKLKQVLFSQSRNNMKYVYNKNVETSSSEGCFVGRWAKGGPKSIAVVGDGGVIPNGKVILNEKSKLI